MDKSLIEKNNPEINVDELLAKIGKEVKHLHFPALDEFSDINESGSFIDIPALTSAVESARAESDVGVTVTPMHHFRWAFVRVTARSAGRIILYLARFITAQQRRFNNFVVL